MGVIDHITLPTEQHQSQIAASTEVRSLGLVDEHRRQLLGMCAALCGRHLWGWRHRRCGCEVGGGGLIDVFGTVGRCWNEFW